MENIDDIIYDILELLDIEAKTKCSERFSEYYTRLASEKKKAGAENFELNKLENIADSLSICHKVWHSDYYEKKGYKVVNQVNRCKCRFCMNCIKLMQATRLKKLLPEIKKAIDEGKHLYHCVFTVRSVIASELIETMDLMNEAFSMLIRYFNGTKKIKGIDFKSKNFFAAVKAIECTYKNVGGWYHPHFHVVFAFDEELPSDIVLPIADDPEPPEGYYENKFSVSKNNPGKIRFFNDDVIMLQKLWRLLYDFRKARAYKAQPLKRLGLLVVPDNDLDRISESGVYGTPYDKLTYKKLKRAEDAVKAERVTLDKINALNDGYSVTFDKIKDEEYFEVFKYAFKFTTEEGKFMDYNQFEVLQDAFNGRRTVQAYGAWFGLKLDDDDIDKEVSETFKKLVQWLDSCESPLERTERLDQVIESVRKYGIKVVSKSSIHKFLNDRCELVIDGNVID